MGWRVGEGLFKVSSMFEHDELGDLFLGVAGVILISC